MACRQASNEGTVTSYLYCINTPTQEHFRILASASGVRFWRDLPAATPLPAAFTRACVHEMARHYELEEVIEQVIDGDSGSDISDFDIFDEEYRQLADQDQSKRHIQIHTKAFLHILYHNNYYIRTCIGAPELSHSS